MYQYCLLYIMIIIIEHHEIHMKLRKSQDTRKSAEKSGMALIEVPDCAFQEYGESKTHPLDFWNIRPNSLFFQDMLILINYFRICRKHL